MARWEGKLCEEIKGASADQVWPLFADFFNLHKWHPGIDTCQPLEGVSGQLGCIRYCAKTTTITTPHTSSDSPAEEKEITTTTWFKERLVAIDHVERSLSYDITENNMGLKFYVATLKVLQLSKGEGCQIEWSFLADPIEGLTYEGLIAYLKPILQGMVQRIENALCATPTSLA